MTLGRHHWAAAFLALSALFVSGAAEAQSPMFAAGSASSDHEIKIQVLSRAIRAGGFDRVGLARAYNSRGNSHAAAGEPARALEDYTAAIGLDPLDPLAFYNRAITLDQLGAHRRAIADYDRAISLAPDFAAAYYNRGRAHQLLFEFGRATEDYRRAFALAPDHPVIRAKMDDLATLPWRRSGAR